MTADQNAPTALARVVGQFEQRNRLKFQPSRQFYTDVGISHIRFGKLQRGTTVIKGPEAKALAAFFNVPVTDLI